MAKTKEISEDLKEIREKLLENKVIIGTDKVLKELKAKNLLKVLLAKNCPENTKNDIINYAKLAGIPVNQLEMDNEELGVFCKKNFFVAVLGLSA